MLSVEFQGGGTRCGEGPLFSQCSTPSSLPCTGSVCGIMARLGIHGICAVRDPCQGDPLVPRAGVSGCGSRQSSRPSPKPCTASRTSRLDARQSDSCRSGRDRAVSLCRGRRSNARTQSTVTRLRQCVHSQQSTVATRVAVHGTNAGIDGVWSEWAAWGPPGTPHAATLSSRRQSDSDRCLCRSRCAC